MGILDDLSQVASSTEKVGKGMCSCGCLLLLVPILILMALVVLGL